MSKPTPESITNINMSPAPNLIDISLPPFKEVSHLYSVKHTASHEKQLNSPYFHC